MSFNKNSWPRTPPLKAGVNISLRCRNEKFSNWSVEQCSAQNGYFFQNIHPCLKVIVVFLLPLVPPLSAFVLEGSQTSYAQFPAWDATSDESRLSFEFRTARPSGLLLYSDSVSCEYLELRLVSGELRARLDMGPGGRAVLAVTSSTGRPHVLGSKTLCRHFSVICS